jgi:hypothetical protein
MFISGALLVASCGGNVDPNSMSAAISDDDPSLNCQAGSVTDKSRACDPAATQKTTICHIPPGNPANAHTLCVGTPSVDAHLAHGDTLGECVAVQPVCEDGGVTPPPAPEDGGTPLDPDAQIL